MSELEKARQKARNAKKYDQKTGTDPRKGSMGDDIPELPEPNGPSMPEAPSGEFDEMIASAARGKQDKGAQNVQVLEQMLNLEKRTKREADMLRAEIQNGVRAQQDLQTRLLEARNRLELETDRADRTEARLREANKERLQLQKEMASVDTIGHSMTTELNSKSKRIERLEGQLVDALKIKAEAEGRAKVAEVLEVQIGPLTLRAEDAEAEAAGLRATLASNTKDSEGTRVALEERVLQLEAKLSERQMFYEDELQKKQLFFDDELQKKQLLLTQLSEFSQTMNSRLASADTLGTSLKSKMRGTAVGQLRAAMIRLVKGILGEVVNDWKSALHESARTKSRDAALRQLKAAMVRFVNGELSAALHNWHLALLEDSLSAAGSEASAAKSMSELGKEAMKSAAMRKLQFVFARQLKGEVYAYTLSWAQNFQEDKQGALFRSCFSALDRRSHCKSPPQLLAQIREVFMLVTQLAGGAFRTGKSQDLWSIWLMDDGAEVRNQAKLNGDIFWKLRQIVVCLKAADDETRKLGIEKNANQDEILSLREEVRTLVQCTPLLLAPGRSAENARFPIDLRWSLTLLPFSLHLMVLDWCGVTSRRALACVCRTLAGVVMIGRLGRRWKDRVYVVGADPMDPTASSTFEVLNCVTQQWGVLEPAGPMEGTAVAVREGQIYASGGFKKLELANWPVTRRVTAFNAQTAQWCIIASMIDSRANHAMSSTCGLLIVAGGRGRHGLLNSVEVLDPKDAQWTPLPPMPGEFAEREFCTAVGTERSLYVFGGSTAQGVPLDVAQVYDCVTMVWTELPPMPRPRSSCSAVQWGLCLVVAGGGHHEIDTLDLQSGEWLTLCAASSPRRFCSTLVFDDTLLLVGGLDNEGIPCDTEKYDPLNDSWTTAPGWGKFGSCLAVAC